MFMKRTIPVLGRVTAFAATLALVAAFIPVFATPAQAREIAHGESGGCSWVIDSDGTLTVSPTSGTSGALENFNGVAPWRPHVDSITAVVIKPGVTASTSLDGMFASCAKMRSADLSGLSTSGVQGMSRMFDGCSALATIDVSRLDTASATNMAGMFRGCTSLAGVDVKNFDTANVTDMSDMFAGTSKLTAIDLAGFNASKVQNMQRMFSNSAVESLDLSSFSTPSLTDMWGMFYGCTALKVLDLSGFDASKVTSMGYLFEECGALERVKIGKGFAFFDESCELPEATWLSAVAGRTYTPNQIATQRKNVADTYVKSRPVYPGPSVVSGAETVWAKGMAVGAKFRSSASIEDFVCVKVDGNVVTPDNYELQGSLTNVTLKPGYLEGLSIAEHSVDIMSATGTASTKFTVSDDPTLSEPVNMYRLYNPNSGEHFYTASEYERDHLVSVGWTYERIGWVAPKGGDPRSIVSTIRMRASITTPWMPVSVTCSCRLVGTTRALAGARPVRFRCIASTTPMPTPTTTTTRRARSSVTTC